MRFGAWSLVLASAENSNAPYFYESVYCLVSALTSSSVWRHRALFCFQATWRTIMFSSWRADSANVYSITSGKSRAISHANNTKTSLITTLDLQNDWKSSPGKISTETPLERYPGSRGPFSKYLRWNKPFLWFDKAPKWMNMNMMISCYALSCWAQFCSVVCMMSMMLNSHR